MQYLPARLISFWYPDALKTFILTWKHLISVIEEDIAVSLMWRMLFTPLFHDSSIVGRVLSFIFRLTRILMGLAGYAMATVLVFSFGLFWFFLPLLSLIPNLQAESILFKVLFILGLALFGEKKAYNPKLKVSQIRTLDQIWEATKIKKEDATFSKLLQTDEVKEILFNLELKDLSLPQENPPLTDSVITQALELARKNHARYISPGYFFVGFVLTTPLIDSYLLKFDLLTSDFSGALKFLESKKQKKTVINIWDVEFAVKHLKGTNRSWVGAPTPELDKVSIDLTRLAAKNNIDELIGREKEVEEIVNILSQEGKKNVVITGKPGVGKTHLVKYLAKKIITGDAPETLATKRIVSLELASLLSGVQTQGELAEKVISIFEEVKSIGGIILFVDEIQDLGIGEVSSSFNLYSLMLPYLESDEFQFIATTEPENYSKILEKNGAFSRLFTKIELPPTTIEETIPMIEYEAFRLESTENIEMTYLAIKLLVQLSNKLIHDRVLPDSALSVLEEAKVLAKDKIISTGIIKEVIEKKVNVPVATLNSNAKEELLNLEEEIHKKMIDQQEAVNKVADTLRRAAVSLREETRPIGSFLFVGPTGVGKTELAKTLAEVYFKQKAAFLRFDMSEYQTDEAVDRLIGDEDSLGELTEAVRNKPYALVLLDEFEKANPKILNLFLQVLDDGRLTDFSSRTIDFTNTIIIATSNVASLKIVDGINHGKNVEELDEMVKEELLKVYKPELVNRFDEIVIFKPLSQSDLEQIVKLKLNELKKLLKDKGYLVEFDQKVLTELTKLGFDPTMGARPLRRLIQDTIEARLSRMILEGKINKGENLIIKQDFLN